MRIVIIGATGNVGLALVRELDAGETDVEVVGVARRRPKAAPAGVEWISADIASDPLEPIVRGADVVVHLAWLIQPGRALDQLRNTNVEGTARLLTAIAAQHVPALVYASSIGAYSPRESTTPIDESWPTHGIATSSYSRQKAYVERMLDDFEARHGDVRVVRLRPGLIFQTEASASQRRYFAGPLLPRRLLRPGVLPVVPHLHGVTFQAVHAEDVAVAYHRAILRDVHGAFNIAPEPILSTADVADLLKARPLPMPFALARTAMDLTWRLRLHPLEPGWLDMAAAIPVLNPARARAELGWEPAFDGREALRTVLRGIAEGAAGPTPPLQHMSTGEELLDAARTGMGQRSSADLQTPPD